MNTYTEDKKQKVLILTVALDSSKYDYYIPLALKKEVQKFEWELDEYVTPIATTLYTDGLEVSLNNVTPFMTEDNGKFYVGFRSNDHAKDFTIKIQEFNNKDKALKELQRLGEIALEQPQGVRRKSGKELFEERRAKGLKIFIKGDDKE